MGWDPYRGPVGSLLARSLKALAAGTPEIPAQLLALGPPQLMPWCPGGALGILPPRSLFPGQDLVPISRSLFPGQGAMWGSRSQQARSTAAPGWSDPEASSLACLGASVPRQGVLAHLCLLLSSSRAGTLLPAQLQGPGGQGGGHVELSPARPLDGARRSPCRLCAPVPRVPSEGAELAGEAA